MSKSMSLFSALLCTFIWGTTFIAQDTGMDNIGPFTFNSVRFFVGFLALAPLVLLFEKKKINLIIKKDKKNFQILVLLIGLSLFLGSALQQVALIYTDVANAAFFTIFYVPMVPIIVFFLHKKDIHWSVWPSVLLCVMGGYLLTNFYDRMMRPKLGQIFFSVLVIKSDPGHEMTRNSVHSKRPPLGSRHSAHRDQRSLRGRPQRYSHPALRSTIRHGRSQVLPLPPALYRWTSQRGVDPRGRYRPSGHATH